MGRITQPPPVKLFIGILTSRSELLPEVEARLSPRLGLVDVRSESFSFDASHYYDAEMGTPILRCFLGFSELIRPGALAEIKIATNQVESAFAGRADVRRPINLDPGYLELAKIVLASTKNFYHRIFLSDGIYGEVTLHFSHGAWHAFPWTFPDFRSGRYDGFFSLLREKYRGQLRSA